MNLRLVKFQVVPTKEQVMASGSCSVGLGALKSVSPTLTLTIKLYHVEGI